MPFRHESGHMGCTMRAILCSLIKPMGASTIGLNNKTFMNWKEQLIPEGDMTPKSTSENPVVCNITVS
ncbi:hypothetical protein JCM33374_g1664 [Metschnikowia sp. JCM 33374]|nr:hypothetical protein JCM33374_g1664 [Metschnikowia sp. JCM 33374]